MLTITNAPVRQPHTEIIAPLQVGACYTFEFISGRVGRFEVLSTSRQPLGFGYSIMPVRGGKKLWVCDKDMSRRDELDVIVVSA
jgi:hypothetical protein